MAITLPSAPHHPNRAPFHGVLTLVDLPSDRPPAGARSHRVLLTRGAAEAALPSLLGMALDYTPSLDSHDARRKIGIITEANIVGHRLEVSGYLFAKDFPDVITAMTAAGDLGMSYEISDAQVADTHASIWRLTKLTFTGAAILRRSKAAYRNTHFELARAPHSSPQLA